VAVHQRAHRRPLPRACARQLFGFLAALGINERLLRWDLPLRRCARYAERLIPDARPTLVINPCSSHALRNCGRTLRSAGAACRRPLADARDPRRRTERARAAHRAEIEQACGSGLVNQIGKDTLRRCSRCCRGRACS